MHGGNGVYQIEAQSTAASGLVPGLFHPVEGGEQKWQVLFGDAHPAVVHAEELGERVTQTDAPEGACRMALLKRLCTAFSSREALPVTVTGSARFQ